MKSWWLYLKSHCHLPDYEDWTDAETKEQAAENFLRQNHYLDAEYTAQDLIPHIAEEEGDNHV